MIHERRHSFVGTSSVHSTWSPAKLKPESRGESRKATAERETVYVVEGAVFEWQDGIAPSPPIVVDLALLFRAVCDNLGLNSRQRVKFLSILETDCSCEVMMNVFWWLILKLFAPTSSKNPDKDSRRLFLLAAQSFASMLKLDIASSFRETLLNVYPDALGQVCYLLLCFSFPHSVQKFDTAFKSKLIDATSEWVNGFVPVVPKTDHWDYAGMMVLHETRQMRSTFRRGPPPPSFSDTSIKKAPMVSHIQHIPKRGRSTPITGTVPCESVSYVVSHSGFLRAYLSPRAAAESAPEGGYKFEGTPVPRPPKTAPSTIRHGTTPASRQSRLKIKTLGYKKAVQTRTTIAACPYGPRNVATASLDSHLGGALTARIKALADKGTHRPMSGKSARSARLKLAYPNPARTAGETIATSPSVGKHTGSVFLTAIDMADTTPIATGRKGTSSAAAAAAAAAAELLADPEPDYDWEDRTHVARGPSRSARHNLDIMSKLTTKVTLTQDTTRSRAVGGIAKRARIPKRRPLAILPTDSSPKLAPAMSKVTSGMVATPAATETGGAPDDIKSRVKWLLKRNDGKSDSARSTSGGETRSAISDTKVVQPKSEPSARTMADIVAMREIRRLELLGEHQLAQRKVAQDIHRTRADLLIEQATILVSRTQTLSSDYHEFSNYLVSRRAVKDERRKGRPRAHPEDTKLTAGVGEDEDDDDDDDEDEDDADTRMRFQSYRK